MTSKQNMILLLFAAFVIYKCLNLKQDIIS